MLNPKKEKVNEKSCLGLHYNGHLNMAFLYKSQIFKFELIKNVLDYIIFLESVSISFDWKREREVLSNGIICTIAVDYNAIKTTNMVSVHSYLMKTFDVN